MLVLIQIGFLLEELGAEIADGVRADAHDEYFRDELLGSTKRFDEQLSGLDTRFKDLENVKLDERVSDLENSDYLGHYREGGIFRIKAVEERTYGLEQC